MTLRDALAKVIAKCDAAVLSEDQATVYHKMADSVIQYLADNWDEQIRPDVEVVG